MSLNKATYYTDIDYCFSDKTAQHEPVVVKIHNNHITDRITNFMPNNIYWETGLFCPRRRCEFHPSLLNGTWLDYACSQPPHC